MKIVQGVSAGDLVKRALASNAELAAVRLDINRARARLRQAGLRPNPTLDFEQQRGVFNTPGESSTSVGVSVPLELGGKRSRRIDLAQAEFEAAQAEVADRERRLANDVRAAYAEAMAAARELSITAELNSIDTQTARVVEARVNEGDAAPLELNLLRVEVDRLRARRALVEGRLQASLLRLKSLTGIPINEPLRLREDLATSVLPDPPAALEAAVEIALRTRPDLRLAQLNEEVAQAGLRLARAQSVPDVTAFSRYSRSRSNVEVQFADTGHGIAPESLEHLFEPYFTTKEKGTGLGLTLTKKLIEDHGGRITVESEVGDGTTFAITLPREPAVTSQPALLSQPAFGVS